MRVCSESGKKARPHKRVSAMFPAALLFLLASCATNAHLPVPGEKTAVQSNLSAEYLAIADEYFALSKFDKAVDYYKRAMKNKTLYWSAYYKLGRSYAMSKKWSDARRIYLKLLNRDPKNLSVRLSLAYIIAMDGRLEQAEEVYKTLWKENPDNADVLVNFISILIAQQKIPEAGARFNELKAKFKDNKNIQAFDKKFEEIRKSVADKRKRLPMRLRTGQKTKLRLRIRMPLAE